MKTDALPFNAFRKTPLDTLKNPLFSLEEMVKDNFWRMQMITIPIVSIRYVPENILKNHRDIWRKDDLIAYQPLSESFLSTEIINLRNNDEVEVFIVRYQKLTKYQRHQFIKKFGDVLLLCQELNDDEIQVIIQPSIFAMYQNKWPIQKKVAEIARNTHFRTLVDFQKLSVNLLKRIGRELILAFNNSFFEAQRYSCDDLEKIIKFVRQTSETQPFGTKYTVDVNWQSICTYQDLSEEFIVRYRDCVDWKKVVEHQKLSVNFLCRYSAHIDFFLFFSTNKFITREILDVLLKRCYLFALKFNKHFTRTKGMRALLDINIDTFKPFPQTQNVFKTSITLRDLARQQIKSSQFLKLTDLEDKTGENQMFSMRIGPENIEQFGYIYSEMLYRDESELFPIGEHFINSFYNNFSVPWSIIFKWCSCSEDFLRFVVDNSKLSSIEWETIVQYQKLSPAFIRDYIYLLGVENVFRYQRLPSKMFDINEGFFEPSILLNNNDILLISKNDENYLRQVVKMQFIPKELIYAYLQQVSINDIELSFIHGQKIPLNYVFNFNNETLISLDVKRHLYSSQQPFLLHDIEYVKKLIFSPSAINIFDQDVAREIVNIENFIPFNRIDEFKILNGIVSIPYVFSIDSSLFLNQKPNMLFHPFIPDEMFDYYPEYFFGEDIKLMRNYSIEFIKKWYQFIDKEYLLEFNYLDEELVELLLNKNDQSQWDCLFFNKLISSDFKLNIATKYNKLLPPYLR